MKRPKVTTEDYIAARTDLAVRNWIVTQHMGLACSVAKQYRRPGFEIEDLVQQAVFGILRALETYEPERGSFATFSTWWIRHFVREYVQRNRAPVDGAHRLTEREIERRMLTVTGKRLETCRQQLAAHRRAASLDATTYGQGSDTFGDTLPSPSDTHAEACASEARSKVQRALSALPDRARYVVVRRMREVTMEEIGAEIGCSRQRVEQIENLARHRMRFAMGGEL
ncbi:MAG: sigma-70 family RNA polymerase sigma factor [Brevundimonas sp.]